MSLKCEPASEPLHNHGEQNRPANVKVDHTGAGTAKSTSLSREVSKVKGSRLTNVERRENNLNVFHLKMVKARSGFRTWRAMCVANRSTAFEGLEATSQKCEAVPRRARI